MKKRTDVKPAPSPLPIVDGRPLIDRSEQERAERSLRTYTMSPEEMAPIIAQAAAKNAYARYTRSYAPISHQKPKGKKSS